MLTSLRRQVSLVVNCGYARVSIYQHSYPSKLTGRKARKNIDTTERAEKFMAQFQAHSTYGIPDGYFTITGKNNTSQFDHDSSKILDSFSLPFRNDTGATRDAYLEIFSPQKWSELASSEKSKHTLNKCVRCFEMHQIHQQYFPLKPQYHPQPGIQVDTTQLADQGVKTFTTSTVAELNRVYNSEASCSFVKALLKEKSLGLERKKTRTERRRERRSSCIER